MDSHRKRMLRHHSKKNVFRTKKDGLILIFRASLFRIGNSGASFGRPQRRWEDNIKTDFEDFGWGGMDWIDLA